MKSMIIGLLCFIAGGLAGMTDTSQSNISDFELGRLDVQREAVRLGLAAWDIHPASEVTSNDAEPRTAEIIWNRNAIRRMTAVEVYGDKPAAPMLFSSTIGASAISQARAELDLIEM